MATGGRTAQRRLGVWAPRKIIELREAKGWSQTKLAAECDVTAAAVMKWETGTEPKASNLIALLRALECSLEDLTE